MPKIKNVRIEALRDGEISTGLREPEVRYLPEGAIVDLPEPTAQSLIDQQRARASTKKANIDLAADADKLAAAVTKLNEANEAERAEFEAEQAEG